MATTERALRQLTGKAEKDIIDHCNKLFEKARKSRLRFERDWYLNLAFYFGKQWVQWQGISQTASSFARLYEPPVPPWRVRLVANRIRPLVRTELAKVTKEKPSIYVVPASADEDDLAAALAGEQIWEFIERDKGVPQYLRRALFWTLICGNGFLKDWWDEKAISSGGQVGDVALEPLSPFHLLVPDIQEETIEGQPYVIHYMGRTPEWVKDKFGVDVQPDVSNSSAGLLEQKFMNALGVDKQEKDMVIVKEAYIKPCAKYPQGAVVHWAGESLLREPYEQWPWEHREYPFTKFDHIPTGRFYNESTIPDLIPVQKEYNRTRSQIIEAKNRMAKPQLIAVRGSLDPNKITSEPGLVILYTAGYTAPQPLPLTALPNYVLEELDRNLRDMDDISGQHEITKGRTPPGVTAATAISFLQEEDDSKISHTVASIEAGIEKVGRHVLSHVNQFWDAERKITVLGDNGVWESFMFSKSSVNGNTDLRVEAGSATPRSLAAKQAFITELGKLGWIPPERALKYLNMAETGRMYEEMMLDHRQAQRENLKMQFGQPVEPNRWDNDAAHIDAHDSFRKRQAFENLPDEIKQIFNSHVQLHEASQMQKAMIQAQQVAMGIPPEAAQVSGTRPMNVSVGAQSQLNPEFYGANGGGG